MNSKKVSSKTTFTPVLLSMLTFGGATNLWALDSTYEAFNRFERLSEKAALEDMWAHQRRLSSSRYLDVEALEPRFLEDPQMRREWYLRLGPAGVPLSLAELDGVRQADLFDELLWALFQESIQADPWEESIPWAQLKQTLSSYINGHPLGKIILKESNHQAWWLWIAGKAFGKNLDKASFNDLVALDKIIGAREQKNPLKRLDAYVFAIALLAEPQPNAARRVAAELLKNSPADETLRRRVFREYYLEHSKSPEALVVFSLLADVDDSQRNFKEGLELGSYSLLIRLNQGEQLSAQNFKKIGDGEYQGEDFKKAVLYYTRAMGSSKDGMTSLDVIDLEVKLLLARYHSGLLPKAETYDAFEEMLDRAFQTTYRDDLLQGYAMALEASKDLLGARDIWLWNFQYSTTKERRVLGVQRASQISADLISQNKAGLGSASEALKWLSYLGTWKRMTPQHPILRHEVVRARNVLSKLGLTQESTIQASLRELEKQ